MFLIVIITSSNYFIPVLYLFDEKKLTCRFGWIMQDCILLSESSTICNTCIKHKVFQYVQEKKKKKIKQNHCTNLNKETPKAWCPGLTAVCLFKDITLGTSAFTEWGTSGGSSTRTACLPISLKVMPILRPWTAWNSGTGAKC